MPGFTGVRPTYKPPGVVPAPKPAAAQGPPHYAAGATNQRATAAAVDFRNALGLPNFRDLLKQFSQGGSGGGTAGGLYEDKQYGNIGAAKTAADALSGQLHDRQAQLAAWRQQIAAQRGNVDKARAGFNDPTHQAGFQNVMRLSGERLGAATEAERQQATEAASRRGYVGGYNPASTERSRLEALATAGYEAAGQEREAQGQLLGQEVGALGTELGGYNTEMGGYGDLLGAYQNLTNAYATTPTKSQSSNLMANPMLDAYTRLLGGASGGFGDLYGNALKGEMFDEENRTTAHNRVMAENRDRAYGRNYYAPGVGPNRSGGAHGVG